MIPLGTTGRQGRLRRVPRVDVDPEAVHADFHTMGGMPMKRTGRLGIAIAAGIFLFAAAPANVPAAEAPQTATTSAAATGSPCDCRCPDCRETPCGKHGHRHGGAMMEEGMGKMKAHLEEMQRAIADLRESERKLEASAGSDPFRAAILEHLKRLDDLQASHLEHMEGMMGRMHPGR